MHNARWARSRVGENGIGADIQSFFWIRKMLIHIGFKIGFVRNMDFAVSNKKNCIMGSWYCSLVKLIISRDFIEVGLPVFGFGADLKSVCFYSA